jgi:membrane-associated phospholipid phosphatase
VDPRDETGHLVREALVPPDRHHLGVHPPAVDVAGARQASVRRPAVWATVLGLLFLGLLVWVALDHGRPLSWDRGLHAAVLRHRAPAMIAAAKPVSVGVEVVAYTLSAVGGALLLRPRSWWRGALVGVGVLIAGQVLRVGLAALIGRDRPPRADWAATAAGYSFPSGHTVSATLAAGLLCLGLLHTLRSAWRTAGVAVAVCWAILDGASRVYQGVHWPSDVLGGWLFGSALILLVAAVLATERVASWTASGPRRSPRPTSR